jgi:hypothetical protein
MCTVILEAVVKDVWWDLCACLCAAYLWIFVSNVWLSWEQIHHRQNSITMNSARQLSFLDRAIGKEECVLCQRSGTSSQIHCSELPWGKKFLWPSREWTGCSLGMAFIFSSFGNNFLCGIFEGYWFGNLRRIPQVIGILNPGENWWTLITLWWQNDRPSSSLCSFLPKWQHCTLENIRKRTGYN